jgi:hypothetical protein
VVSVNTRIRSGATVLLDVLADVKGAYPSPSQERIGNRYETMGGPTVQYGSSVRSMRVVEIHIPYITKPQIDTIHAMLRGDYGDAFVVESPRETFNASIIPGEEGATFEMYPCPPGQSNTVSKAIIRMVRI